MRIKNTVNKILIISSIFLCFVSIVGCTDNDDISLLFPETEATVGERDNDTIYIWTDEDTGVQYVIYQFGGITPRLNSDGSLYIAPTTVTEAE